MQKSQEQILVEALTTTFYANLAFLSEYDPDLYTRINNLNEAINQNQYKEHFHLEFIKEDQEFDIYDEQNKTYLYNRKPKNWNNKAVKTTNFDLSSIFGQLSTNNYYSRHVDLTDIDVSDIFGSANLKTNSDIKNFTNYLKLDLFKEEQPIKNINKFIFMGTLLGRHIPKILEKINSKDHFVYENNLEIFRLSLFVCDYSILARDNRSVIFSIMDEEFELNKKIETFLKHNYLSTYFLKYYSTGFNIDYVFNNFATALTIDNPFGFDYNMKIHSLIKQSVEKINSYEIIKFNDNSDILEPFKDKPILFVGAGPSLDIDFDWLKENHHKFILVAVGSVFNHLALNNIQPDIITSVDPQTKGILRQFDIKYQHIYKKAIFIASVNTDKKVLDLFEKIFLFEVSGSFRHNSFPLYGTTIGEITMSMLLLLNAPNIYMLGLDMAIDENTGQSHSSDNVSKDNLKLDMKNINTLQDGTINMLTDLLQVKGNLKEIVYTTRSYNNVLNTYNRLIDSFNKKDIKIYNLSQKGAYVRSSIPINSKDINCSELQSIDKTVLHNELIDSIKKRSTFGLTKEEKSDIEQEIAFINQLLQTIQSIKESKISTFANFKTQLETIIVLFNTAEIPYLRLFDIYKIYQKIIFSYINYAFNQKEIRQESKKIRTIKYMWCLNISDMINSYKKYLNKLI